MKALFERLNWGNIGVLVGVIVGINVVLTIWNILYNLYFHPLRNIPGPRSWIAFPAMEQIAMLQGTREYQVRDFHEKYGEAVRWGPEKVTFTCASAWKDICGHGHAELPKFYPPGVVGDGTPSIITAGASDHFKFRRAMLPAFSDKALGQQEPLMAVYVDLLMTRLREVANARTPTNMVHWYTLTTFDLIGDLAFGESFEGLSSGKSNEWIQTIEKLLKVMPVLAAFSIFPTLSKIVMWFLGSVIRKSQQSHLQKVKALAMKRVTNSAMKDRGDFMDHIMRSRGEKHGLSDDELASNSDTLIIAGSETTATLLSGVTYYLLCNPKAMEKCVEEVRGAYQSADEIDFKSTTANLPYMLACLNEALRLFPPVPIVLPRITLPGFLTPIASYQIPEKTQVGVHQLAAYHSSRNFHRAREFHPERWLPEAQSNVESPFYNDNREVHKPFSFGPRDCIGRNLAFHEMRLVLAHVLFRFDLELCKDCEGWAENQRVFALWEKPPLMVNITERQE